MPENDLALLSEAARQSGEIATKFATGKNRVWEKSPDNPVTEADHAVDQFLKETLLASRPDYGWLSEDTKDDPARLDAKRIFVVDPIDGTRAMIRIRSNRAASIDSAGASKAAANTSPPG